MKKILLLLFLFLFGISEVYASDILSTFYYDEEKVKGMWVNREKGDVLASGLPFFLKRESDESLVYCLEPFVEVKEEVTYEGYYEINDKFNINNEDLERIRLLSYFGYGYPGHRTDKWYGITQYLIWKTVEKDADIYFADVRYGNKVIKYEGEIKEIETLIDEYQELLNYHNNQYTFNSYEQFLEFKASNIFLEGIDIGGNIIALPTNLYMQNKEIFFYHAIGQNLYMSGEKYRNDVLIDIKIQEEIVFKKWYGSGKYKEEEGAVFDIYKDDKLYETITTNKQGEATLTLDYGDYKIVQKDGKEGYLFIEDTEFTVSKDSTNLIELYDEAIVVEVPDTYKSNSINELYKEMMRYIHAY